MVSQNSLDDKKNICLNCQFPLIDQADFCHKCGQKNADGRLTVKELFAQFFDNVFNLDSKIFKTLAAVFVPGKLTNAFLSGQRGLYYHPIRLFLVLVVISLACLNFQSEMTAPGNLKMEHIDKLNERKRLMDVLDSGIDTLSKNTKDVIALKTLDTLSKFFYKNSGRRIDSVNINEAMKITDDFDFYIAIGDLKKYTAEEILEIYEVKGFFRRLMIQQKIKMLKEGTNFIPFVMSKVTWVIFFVLLLLALVLSVLYLKSDFLYLEHLIFSIHLSSFFLIVLSVLNLLPWDFMGFLVPIILIILASYLFISMKRIYKQSYLITSLKFILVLGSNFFLFILGFVLTIIGSFLIF